MKYPTPVVFVAMLLLLWLLAPLEIDGFKLKTPVYSILWLSLPVIIYHMFPANGGIMGNIVGVIGTVVYVFITLVLGFIFLSGFCAWVNQSTRYISQKDSSVKIIQRGYACYGTDDDKYLFKQRKLTKHIKWVTEFNETRIDTLVWKEAPYDDE